MQSADCKKKKCGKRKKTLIAVINHTTLILGGNTDVVPMGQVLNLH